MNVTSQTTLSIVDRRST